MIVRATLALVLTCTSGIAGQSTLLNALDEAGPLPLAGRTTALSSDPLSSIWSDPTWSPRSTGILFGIDHTQFSDVQMWYVVSGFKLGPRWSFTIGGTQFGDLFDTSLVNQDPSLGSFSARATRAGMDVTTGRGPLTGSLGLGYASDANVGDDQNTTIARAGLRLSPSRFPWLSLGLAEDRAIGGSIPEGRGGRSRFDASVTPVTTDAIQATVAAGVSNGSLWRYSEARRSCGVDALVTLARLLSISTAVERYETTYGSPSAAWAFSVGGALRVSSFHLGVRYSSTGLGAGSGYGFTLSFEP